MLMRHALKESALHRLCRNLGAGALLAGLSLAAGCAVELAPDPATDEDQLVSQLGDSFGEADKRGEARSCVAVSLRSRACRDDWRALITRACAAFGGTVSDAALSDACEGGFHSASFRCCPAAPPPPPPPDRCFSEAQGDVTSCEPEATWKEYAAKACEAKGATLRDLGFSERCGDGQYRQAKYTCCAVDTPPPPPPPMCVRGEMGGTTSCKPEATWKEYAAKECLAKGLTLTDLGFAERCGDGQYRFAKYACCGATPPPPPMCVTAEQGDVTSCKPEATWKEYAAKDCLERGLTLRDLAFTDRCGDGQYRHAKYSCCK